MQKGSTGKVTSTTLSVARIGPADGVVVEGSFQGGVKHEVLRSMCKVANETQVDLEVALSKTEDDWHEIAAHSGSQSFRSQRQSTSRSSSRSASVTGQQSAVSFYPAI